MSDTDPSAQVATATGRPRAGSTSSTPPGPSFAVEDVVELGERILSELDASTTNNTLTRWLAHHTARLIQVAEAAHESGAPDADRRAADARAAVLDLWQSRSAWPSGWPPPRAAKIAHELETLPELGESALLHSGVLKRLQSLHHQVIAALVMIAAIRDPANVEERWPAMFSEELTADEVSVLQLAVTSRERLEPLERWLESERAGDATEPNPLVELADNYRDIVVGVFARALVREEDDQATEEDPD